MCRFVSNCAEKVPQKKFHKTYFALAHADGLAGFAAHQPGLWLKKPTPQFAMRKDAARWLAALCQVRAAKPLQTFLVRWCRLQADVWASWQWWCCLGSCNLHGLQADVRLG